MQPLIRSRERVLIARNRQRGCSRVRRAVVVEDALHFLTSAVTDQADLLDQIGVIRLPGTLGERTDEPAVKEYGNAVVV